MSFSYTEKKRVRRSFEKISSVMELPNLLATQVQSYDAFLQRYVDSNKRLNERSFSYNKSNSYFGLFI